MLCFAQNDTHNIMGYIFVTRKQMEGLLAVGGVHFCNPQTVGRGVGGGGMGYIFVTREQMGWVVGGGGMGYIFVIHKQWGGLLAVGMWVTFL